MSEAYTTIVHLIERLHRHFLDVLRVELRRLGIEDINAVQALLLFNIGDDDVVIRDLKDRGYYHGSNVSYNIKKLTEFGYLSQTRAAHDKRATKLQMTDKGRHLCESFGYLQNHLTSSLEKHGLHENALGVAAESLQNLERLWTDYIRYDRL